MNKKLMTMGLFGLLSLTSPLCYSTPAHAGNSNVESTIEGMGDLSMFYQAMLNTGVINELSESEHYTIFAPTNAAFARLSHDNYPCFYSAQCRPQIAALLRNHIIIGRHDLADLKTYGQGLQTLGDHQAHVVEAFVNDYKVDGQQIISQSDSGGNTVYRINGIISTPQELSQFQAVSYVPTQPNALTEQTVMHRYETSDSSNTMTAGYPTALTSPNYGNQTETTTIIHSYDVQSQ